MECFVLFCIVSEDLLVWFEEGFKLSTFREVLELLGNFLGAFYSGSQRLACPYRCLLVSTMDDRGQTCTNARGIWPRGPFQVDDVLVLRPTALVPYTSIGPQLRKVG